ncbi:hypothetical protein NW757_013722, partial [Fusarium falciforme]
MGRIYKDSALTIAATGASDEPSNGLYGDRLDKAQYVKIPFKIKDRKRRGGQSDDGNDGRDDRDDVCNDDSRTENIEDEDEDKASEDDSDAKDRDEGKDEDGDNDSDEEDKGFFYACLPPRGFDEEVTNSRLFTRGWVLQERLLSPRYLHFGKDQWFWQCRQLTVAEVRGFENGAITVGADLGFSPPILKNPIKFALWWTKVVEAYSRLDFTVCSDRFIALNGLVNELWKATPQEYHHGLWSPKLYIQLLWSISAHPDDGNTKPSAAANPTQPTQTAPSWSWLSILDPVNYPDQKDTYEPSYDELQQKVLDFPETKIVRPMIEHRFNHDRHGNMTVLIIRGQVREARISNLSIVSDSRSQLQGGSLNPDRVGPLESLANGLYNRNYPETPLLAVAGSLQDQE